VWIKDGNFCRCASAAYTRCGEGGWILLLLLLLLPPRYFLSSVVLSFKKNPSVSKACTSREGEPPDLAEAKRWATTALLSPGRRCSLPTRGGRGGKAVAPPYFF